jgi:hypothetical protein
MLDSTYKMAYRCGAYQALAQMMAESIRELDSKDKWTREWAQRRLVSLAEQLEETEKKFEKELDTA